MRGTASFERRSSACSRRSRRATRPRWPPSCLTPRCARGCRDSCRSPRAMPPTECARPCRLRPRTPNAGRGRSRSVEPASAGVSRPSAPCCNNDNLRGEPASGVDRPHGPRYNDAPRMNDDTASISDRYEPAAVEARWYPVWEKNGYFRYELPSKKKPFCIVMPPPNVTGALHMGHALDMSLQDLVIRMQRMDGFNTLWQPGTDHAGIATQVVVERQLASEGKTKDDLGRDEFLRRVRRWQEESGG